MRGDKYLHIHRVAVVLLLRALAHIYSAVLVWLVGEARSFIPMDTSMLISLQTMRPPVFYLVIRPREPGDELAFSQLAPVGLEPRASGC